MSVASDLFFGLKTRILLSRSMAEWRRPTNNNVWVKSMQTSSQPQLILPGRWLKEGGGSSRGPHGNAQQSKGE